MDTPGGRDYAGWDDLAPVTREGQLIFFFQFLHVGGRWEEFLRDCPLHCTGNRGSLSPALGLPWILDIDVTVKSLYGHQKGAEIG